MTGVQTCALPIYSVFNGIFVITPYMHGPTIRATHVSAAFDASSSAFFSTNIFIFLSSFLFLWSNAALFFLSSWLTTATWIGAVVGLGLAWWLIECGGVVVDWCRLVGLVVVC